MDTVRQLMERVNISPASITRVFATRFVTASVEHIPRTCLRTGLSSHNPDMKMSLLEVFLFTAYYPFLNGSKFFNIISSSEFKKFSTARLVPVAPVIASRSFSSVLDPNGFR